MPEFKKTEREIAERTSRLLSIDGKRTVDSIHRELGHIMWEYCGMARNDAGLHKALELIPKLREEFWTDVNVPGTDVELNQSLENAGRVADFLELGELMFVTRCIAKESCGGHFREEHQTPDGEALRDDEHFAYVAAWEYAGADKTPILNKEPLEFENVAPLAAELQVMNLTLHVWRQPSGKDTGRLETYEARDVSPDMSFLEMLDVVNEELIDDRQAADRVRPRLPRRDLRIVRHDDQRRRARSDKAQRRRASCTCAASRTATRFSSSRGARGRSR